MSEAQRPDTLSAIASTAFEHVQRIEHDLALDVIARVLESHTGPVPPRLNLIKAHAFFGLERLQLVDNIASAVIKDTSATANEIAEAKELVARTLSRWGIDLDYAIHFAREAAAIAEKGGDAMREAYIRARVSAAVAFARKRARATAARELEVARGVVGDDALIRSTEAWLALEFDDRVSARDAYARCLELPGNGPRFGRIGLSRVARLLGDFDGAHRELDALGAITATDLPPRVERATIFASQRKWEDASRAFLSISAASPFGDSERWARSESAYALMKAGKREEGLAALEALATSADDQVGRRAKRTVQKMRAAASGTPSRTRLASFPTVAQLRDHCGPACCELYLSYFGVAADQVEIARKIKRPNSGTPIYAMREFLEDAGLTVLRVEADLPRMKWLIDNGFPIILEEEYSTTRHVAVATGYDDEREILEVQDPMTHNVRETPYEDLPRLLALANHGVLVGYPREDVARAALLKENGVVDATYITLIDSAWKAFNEKRYDDARKLCDESIALRRDYELAWMCLYELARSEHDATPSDATKKRIEWVLSEMLALWPDAEWPQQYVGHTHYNFRRYQDALMAFEKARDRDDPDANNWSMIGECMIALGRPNAMRPFNEALRRMPWHRRATENLADLLEQTGEVGRARALNDAAREVGGDNPFNHEVLARLCERANDAVGALNAYDEAIRVAPKRTYAVMRSARTLARLERVDDAIARVRPLLEANPDDLGIAIDLADLLYAHGRPDLAATECRRILEKNANNTSAQAILGASLCALDKLDEGMALLRAALVANPAYAWIYAEMAKHLLRLGKNGEAAEAAAAATGLSANDHNRFLLASALAAAGAQRDAAGRMRNLVTQSQLDEEKLSRAVQVIADAESLGSAHDLLTQIEKQREGDSVALAVHAQLLLERGYFPRAAAPIIEKLSALKPEHPFVLMTRGQKLFDSSCDDEAQGEQLLRSAIAKSPSLRAPRIALAASLSTLGRRNEALELLTDSGDAFVVRKNRIEALVGDGRTDEALAEANREVRGASPQEALELKFLVAQAKKDYAVALEFVEQLIRAGGEREDDGALDYWETHKFKLLLRLNEVERALKFGSAQIGSADDAGYLAYLCMAAERTDLSEPFAKRALAEAPTNASALNAMARLAELAGNADEAKALWTSMADANADDHRGVENLARLALAEGQVDAAVKYGDAAVRGGHKCPWSFGVRAQARILSGDRDGAKADLERCYAISDFHDKATGSDDVWAVREALLGNHDKAASLARAYFSAAKAPTPSDKARVVRVLAALGVEVS